MPEPPYPLDPSLEAKLDPQYADFYNKHLISLQQVHYQSVEANRTSGTLLPGASPPQPCDTKEYGIPRSHGQGEDVKIRVYTPAAGKPSGGWPVAIYLHGGGWVLGNLNSEHVICTHICARASCVVVSVDYRLAPESPFPAAVEDCWEAVSWVQSTAPSLLGTNKDRIAIGGSSAGGNLAAVMTQRAVAAGQPSFLKQVHNVPVLDNTATVDNNKGWRTNEFTTALPAEKMLWYRRHYLPNKADHTNPEASPLLWKGDWAQLPPATVIVGELDVLSEEGEQYVAKLQQHGVRAEIFVMKGLPHPFLIMDGVLDQAAEAMTIVCEAFQSAFGW